ncbi:MAG: rod shape-determining protein MreD [Flavobacteriales bacterium]|nr:rod shape-determining protein MreD [Flavobacteriales bacterium]
MISNLPKIASRFIFLILLQVLILNNVAFSGYINPYLYVLFILMLPFDTPKWLSLVLAFFLGFTIDIFTSTLGMHIAASLFMAYSREHLLRLFAPRDGYDPVLSPTIPDMGIVWYLSYAGILTFLHHAFLFTIEVFRFSEFFSTIGRALLSTFFTLILILISQLLIYRKK